MVWPQLAGAAGPAAGTLPVVTNINGAVSVVGHDGVSRNVIRTRIVRSGDKFMTGVASLAEVSLADVGSIRIGPTTTGRAIASTNQLSINIVSGSACAQALTQAVSLQTEGLNVSAVDQNAIFSVLRGPSSSTVAVYQGSVNAQSTVSSQALVLKEGQAASATGGSLQRVAIENVQPAFSSLRCPDDDVIARIVPSPVPSAEAAAGHGGGAGAIIGILLGLGAIAAAAGHGGGGGGGGIPPTSPPTSGPGPSPSPTPGPIVPVPSSYSFSNVGAGAAQPLHVSEANYNGPFAVDAGNCNGVANVNPLSSSGNFTVTPIVAGGPCTLSVSDNHGTAPARVSVTVGPFGPPIPAPAFVTLSVGGAAATFNVTESGYTGQFTVSACSNGAASLNTNGPATSFTVAPVSTGNCAVTISDGQGPGVNSSKEDVFVSAGTLAIVPSPPQLQFADISTNPGTQTFTASDPGCGLLDLMTATPDGTVVTSVSPSGGQLCSGGTPITFTVTVGADGRGSVTVVDTAGGSAVVSVGVGTTPLAEKRHKLSVHKGLGTGSAPPHGSVSHPAQPRQPVGGSTPSPRSGNAPSQAPGPLSASSQTILLSAGATQALIVSEPAYLRGFSLFSSNPNVASLSALRANGPNATILVTGRVPGSATLRITDDHGGWQIVYIIVRASAAVRPAQRP